MFSKFGQEISQDEIDVIMASHDCDNTGQIDFDGFKQMILDTKHSNNDSE